MIQHLLHAGEHLPNPRAPSARGRDDSKRVEARGAAPVEPEAKNPLADFAGAETLSTKPVERNIPHELASKVGMDVRPRGEEGGPSVGGTR